MLIHTALENIARLILTVDRDTAVEVHVSSHAQDYHVATTRIAAHIRIVVMANVKAPAYMSLAPMTLIVALVMNAVVGLVRVTARRRQALLVESLQELSLQCSFLLESLLPVWLLESAVLLVHADVVPLVVKLCVGQEQLRLH